jgi:DNA-directed RNA polymerase subunit RPC12/RpoP
MVTGFFGVLGHVRNEFWKFTDAPKMMRRTRTDPTKFDLTHPCPHCGYKIPPRELLHIDGEHIRCPKCGKDSVYGSSLKQ